MTMVATNRKLLEQAALAAQDPVEGWTADANFVPVAILRSGARWQPLLPNQITDCMGDALRLAVKLRIDIITRDWSRETWAQAPMHRTVLVPWEGNEYAATRLAIVRAAAAIGRLMP